MGSPRRHSATAMAAGRGAVRAMSLCASVAVASAASTAAAADVAPHGNFGVAHAVGGTQGREFGFGIQGSAGLEVGLAKALGLEAHVGGAVLAKGEPPLAPNVAEQSTGTALLVSAGVRIHALSRREGLWIAGRGGFAQTGSLSRALLTTELGWDFRAGATPLLLGPYVSYAHIVQPDDSFRADDARLVAVGLHVSYGKVATRSDRDRDTVFDDEDACPDAAGPRTGDPRTTGCPEKHDRDMDTIVDEDDACPDVAGKPSADRAKNGCPPDRDGDAVLDADDACPDVAGVRSSDPKTNGCPSDRDNDGVPDALDACPDLAGVRSLDPKTNGCPADTDKDGVPDAEDACPEVPGPKTNDPKTTGCPPADEKVRLQGDRILLDEVVLFDVDSPRVRHASFGILRKAADFIKKTPDILEVSIEGHADATGTEEHNRVLSRARADSVVRLLERFGVEGSRLKAESFGRSRLKVDTQAPERRNRRVELFVTRSSTNSAAPKNPAGAPTP